MTKRPRKQTPPTSPNGSSFRDFYNQIVAEAVAEGPEALAELEAMPGSHPICSRGTSSRSSPSSAASRSWSGFPGAALARSPYRTAGAWSASK